MLKRHKDLLRPLVAQVRAILAGASAADGIWQRGDLDRELERLGVAPDGTTIPIDTLPNPAALERRIRAVADAYLAAAANGLKGAEAEQKRQTAREELIERAAYTWINRLLALRTMEARGLTDETLRANPDYEGISEALFIVRQTAPARCAGADGGWWAAIEDACAAQATFLPGLFDLNDPAAALRPSIAALLRCVALIGGAPAGFTLEEADAAFTDPDAIGWAYQFYQEAAKARVYARLGSGGKAASRAEIAAATQLFTEPYMVQWLLQNSLGRSYHEAYPGSKLPESWAYYIRQRPAGQTAPEAPRPLEALDLIDPCCGSGHFLREAFDMFAAMYRERHPTLSAAEITDRVLERHLHGIDLDPRAAQLAALTLYLRAWEFVKNAGKRLKAKGFASITYQPPALNIATTPSFSKLDPSSRIPHPFLARHLRRHPQDRLLKPLLEGVFGALEQADILGSLLRPAEQIDAAMQALQQSHTIPMDFEADDAALRRTITTMARHDPAELKRMLLDRVAQSFAAESGNADDVAAQLFGREAERGVRLLQLLDRKYAVVATNPPYMGSGNMDVPLKRYVEQHFRPGKRDLYATFIMRCLELCCSYGRVAMITQQSWMFLRSYADLRMGNQGLLQKETVEALAHLGPGAFSEISGVLVNTALAVFAHAIPSAKTNSIVLDARSYANYVEKDTRLRTLSICLEGSNVFHVDQLSLLGITNAPFLYSLPRSVLELTSSGDTAGKYLTSINGSRTGDNTRFLRLYWENPGNAIGGDWRTYVKGGSPSRWIGNEEVLIDWSAGAVDYYRSSFIGRCTEEQYWASPGLSFSKISRGNLTVRYVSHGISDYGGPVLKASSDSILYALISILNTHYAAYFSYTVNPSNNTEIGDIYSIPIGNIVAEQMHILALIAKQAITYKDRLLSGRMLSFRFQPDRGSESEHLLGVLLALSQSGVEQIVADYLHLEWHEFQTAGVSPPSGFHPLITGYDTLPKLPPDLKLPALPQEVLDYLAAHERITPPPAELERIKARLSRLYEDGPGAKEDQETTEDAANGEDEEDAGAHFPIPTETFLEELSVKLQIHPISVYWLLEELRTEGARCKPEEQRLLEDRLSVLVLRLLGHRWPKQIEAGEPVPPWADPDGIIPITLGAGETTLADRLRARLRAEEDDLGVQRTEALLAELTGLTLEEWVRREFFKRHVRQFKYRPVAWHLASKPIAATRTAGKGRGGRWSVVGGRLPAFECMLYYHACGGDILARIRTQYVDPLLRAERQRAEDARRANDETAAALATERIQELEAFAAKLRQVADQGFAGPELDKLLEQEPFDRWSGDGYLGPAERADLLRQERAWRVDLNDGVRVNIAPVQLAGLLVSEVLKAADAKQAIADRARWRSDERHWVRAGKLPRCG